MHSATDENYQRGYEWWLMTEAKKVHDYYVSELLFLVGFFGFFGGVFCFFLLVSYREIPT